MQPDRHNLGKDKLKVVLRFRPDNHDEQRIAADRPFTVTTLFDDGGHPIQAVRAEKCSSCVEGKIFDTFNSVLSPEASQLDVYMETTHALVQDTLQGGKNCVLAYGQSGGGKTHSMVGPEGNCRSGEQRGAASAPPPSPHHCCRDTEVPVHP